jgi:hypothetical protein
VAPLARGHPALAGQLTWMAPILCLCGLGLLAGAVSGRPAVASVVAASLSPRTGPPTG